MSDKVTIFAGSMQEYERFSGSQVEVIDGGERIVGASTDMHGHLQQYVTASCGPRVSRLMHKCEALINAYPYVVDGKMYFFGLPVRRR